MYFKILHLKKEKKAVYKLLNISISITNVSLAKGAKIPICQITGTLTIFNDKSSKQGMYVYCIINIKYV